ncbi:hypothetical protein EBZ80_06335 [bacterium]|nr:hypothetical protein [bacterium]
MPRRRAAAAPSPKPGGGGHQSPKIPADLRLYFQQRPPPLFRDLSSGSSAIQNYFPSLELLFPSLMGQSTGRPTLVASELAVELSGGLALVESLRTRLRRADVPVWMRVAHLIPPWDYLDGTLMLPGDAALPAPRDAFQRTLRKINNPYHEAYTDALFACMASRLVETGRSPHWCRFYGTFNGRVPEYRYNITDYLPEYQHESWFRRTLAEGLFTIEVADPFDASLPAERFDTSFWESEYGGGWRRIVGDAGSSEGLSELSELSEDIGFNSGSSRATALSELEEIEEEAAAAVAAAEIEVARAPRRVRITAHTPTTSGSGSGSGSSGYPLEFRAILRDYPCQMTVLERCDGMMDSLMDDEHDPDVATADMRETLDQRWTAWVFQVIAGLAVAQEHYGFVHNDLHTGNVMWCGTPETHLYYHVRGAAGGDRWYRVPTYGRLMKIIDFGRATFRPTAAAAEAQRTWFPDTYGPGGDAEGMFNGGKLYEPDDFTSYTQPANAPNRSFDLTRLAIAMLEALWPEPPATKEPRRVLTREPGRVTYESVSPLWNLLWLWLTDRHGKNILYRPDGGERYEEFEQYVAITRDAHNAVPARQLTLPLFDAAFRCARRDMPEGTHVWELNC